ncbi:MAG: glycosyltransferase family 2 protein [Verrucomicrobiota bacterium]
MTTPVLFLGFNRPDLAARVLERLRGCGTRRLYVALDAPRPDKPEDVELCRSMKSLVDAVDWADEKIVLQREKNLGCGRAVSTAITWFFHHVDRGIILEDDCLPDPTFFSFCGEMLQRYAGDQRVGTVSGTGLIPDGLTPDKSHFFSKYVGIWGWATWRRWWATYDYNLSSLSAEEWTVIVRARSGNAVECRYWLHILDLMLEGKIDTWDFQVQFSAWKGNALHVTSSCNLVENLGFRGDATHTRDHSPLAERLARPNPPPYSDLPVLADEPLDRIIFGEKLHASLALAEWLFGGGRESELGNQAERLAADLAEARSQAGQLTSDIASQAEDIQAMRSELAGYYGFSGALRCLCKIF